MDTRYSERFVVTHAEEPYGFFLTIHDKQGRYVGRVDIGYFEGDKDAPLQIEVADLKTVTKAQMR